jgi:hypothetical protein
MRTSDPTPSTTDIAREVNIMLAGLGLLTVQFFPLALPLLLLTIAPLAVLALPLLLLGAVVILPLRLVRRLLRS